METTQTSEREMLERILQRLDALDAKVDAVAGLASQLPAIAGSVGDTFDDYAGRLRDRGVMLDERLRDSLQLLEKLSDPKTQAALRELTDNLPQLAELTRSLPGMIAAAGDTFDDWARRAGEEGFDVAAFVAQLPHVLRALAEGAYALHSVEIIGEASRALQKGVEEAAEGKRVGMLGMIRMMSDPDVQRSLAFVNGVAREFGKELKNGRSAETGESHG